MKTQKNIFMATVVMLTAIFMIGCEKNDTVASGTPSNTSSVEPIVTTASVSSDPVTATPVVIDNPDVTVPDNGNDDNSNQQVNVPEEDPYEVLLMTPEIAINKTLNYALLYRDGSYYALGSSGAERAFVYKRDNNTLFTAEEYPILTLEEGDTVFGYTRDGSVPKLTLRKAEKIGYTIPLTIDDDGDSFMVDMDGRAVMDYKLDINSLEIQDEDGNSIPVEINDEDNLPALHNLEKGKTYTFGWYEGIYFQGYDLISNSIEYRMEKEVIEIPGEITKEGYIYDFSGVEPGLYSTNIGGLITIQ